VVKRPAFTHVLWLLVLLRLLLPPLWNVDASRLFETAIDGGRANISTMVAATGSPSRNSEPPTGENAESLSRGDSQIGANDDPIRDEEPGDSIIDVGAVTPVETSVSSTAPAATEPPALSSWLSAHALLPSADLLPTAARVAGAWLIGVGAIT